MSLSETMRGDRVQIAVFGRRNAGKSSLINALTGQQAAIVSGVKGTTTDPVYQAMEILPLGPCMLIDTPGLDDEGELGRKRVEKARQVLRRTDIVLLVMDAALFYSPSEGGGAAAEGGTGRMAARGKADRLADWDNTGKSWKLAGTETELLEEITDRKLPCILVLNQADRLQADQVQWIADDLLEQFPSIPVCAVSAADGTGIEGLKDLLAKCIPQPDQKLHIIGDFVKEGDMVVLVTPIDEAAPKGRLIMPQQQVIRDLLDNHAVPVVTQVPELPGVLQALGSRVRMVVTDSQAFGEVSKMVPEEIPLTSFSILFARHKGNLKQLASGVKTIEQLQDGDRVLIAEGCTHRRQCGDIGTVKIPAWLREHTGKDVAIETCSGKDFPEDLSAYKAVIHCGGCTLPEQEMKYRMSRGKASGTPIINYGIFIAYVKGIFERSTALFSELKG